MQSEANGGLNIDMDTPPTPFPEPVECKNIFALRWLTPFWKGIRPPNAR